MRLKVNCFSIYLFVFFLLLNFQTLGLTGWIKDEESSIKLYHLFSVFFIPCLLLVGSRNALFKMPFFILEYFIGIILISLLLFLIYPFNRLLLNHVFAFYAFFIGYHLARILSTEEIFSKLRQVVLVVSIIIVGKLLFHIPEIRNFMKAPDGHPDIYTIYGGGTNLEATWLGLNSAIFVNRKRLFYILLIITFLVSILYASRVGVVIAFLVAGFKFISSATSYKERKSIIALSVLAAVAFIILVDLDNLAEKVYALKRFTDFGDSSDKGMAGRFAMWQYYGTALWESKLMGYGAGNGMYAIESVSGNDYPEDNLHNLYMQILLEFGCLGLLLYLIIVYNISFKAFKARLVNPIAIVLLIYFIASLIQFRGTDALIWFFMGIFLQTDSNRVNFASNEA
ncbi:O-antigen ligase family protein [uncultured Pontibacter sp.]|uniref:O-antigen ligase family protein n=1 Tax=uncultured Pontibacter sp. TaxID=453356 RepID=UPI002622AD6C|nr:O-antigen ligase family protein [uncultured Pontibacter sp.]